MNKSLIIVLGALIFAMLFTACGAAERSEPAPTPPPATDPVEGAPPNGNPIDANGGQTPNTSEDPLEKPLENEDPGDRSPSPVDAEPPEVVEPSEPVTYVVEIEGFAFAPDVLEIRVGDSITFTNRDSPRHTATEENGLFDTGMLGQDESETITFNEAGTFAYICTPHPNMQARILVLPAD